MGWWQEIRLAARSLRANPVVAIVAILSLALGIGANTAMFSIVDSLLLRPLPVKDPAQLALVTDGTTGHVRVWSNPVWMQIRQRPDLFARSAAWSFTRFDLASGGEAQPVDGAWVSGSFFDMLGVPAIVGRVLADEDDRPGARGGAVAVISYPFWQRHFDGAKDVVGRSLRIADVPFMIVGVTPRGFFGPDVGRSVDVMMPLADEPLIRGRDSVLETETTFLTIGVRLRSDQPRAVAEAALNAVRPQIRAATVGVVATFSSGEGYLRYLGTPFTLVPGATGFSVIREEYQRPLMTILAVVALLLLIACINIANLLAARAIAKRSELALRLALGAPRWRLVRQLLTESALLYAVGAVAGLAIAVWGSRALVGQIVSPIDNVFLDLSLNARILLFNAAVAAAATLLSGTVPAFCRSAQPAAMEALHSQRRVMAGRASLPHLLIAVQIALSLVLVVAAGLFVRTFASLTSRSFGFDADRVVVVIVDAHHTENDPAPRLAEYERVRDAVRAVPGVADAALSLTTPVANGQFTPRISMDEAVPPGPVWANLITPGWFATYGTALVAGRDIADSDRRGGVRVAVVNEAFARMFGSGRPIIGRTFVMYPATPRQLGPIRIVGIVRDAVYGSLRGPAPPTYYVPIVQFDHLMAVGIKTINLSVRSSAGSPMPLTRSIADAVASVDPRVSLTFRPLSAQISASLSRERIVAVLGATFGNLALLLAAIGLYGVTAYAVAQRRTEIGIRMALGADRGAIERLVLARVSAIVAAGIVAGVVLSAWAATFVSKLLYGLQPRDPATLAGAAVTLAVVSGAAGWLPAWRASRIDPAEVLRTS